MSICGEKVQATSSGESFELGGASSGEGSRARHWIYRFHPNVHVQTALLACDTELDLPYN